MALSLPGEMIETLHSRLNALGQQTLDEPASAEKLIDQVWGEMLPVLTRWQAAYDHLDEEKQELESQLRACSLEREHLADQVHQIEQRLAFQATLAEAQNRELLRENRRQMALLEAIFDADPGGVAVLVGEDLRFAFTNPAYRFIIPDPTQNPIGLPYNQVWPHEGPRSHQDHFRKVLKTGQPFQRNGIEHQFPDGTRRTFTLQARRIEWENQPAVLLILWDTTELKRAEQALRESIHQEKQKTAQLEAVLETVPAAVWIAHDRESRLITGNRYSSEFLRMHAGDNLSKTAPEGQAPRHFLALKDGQEIPPDQLPVQLAAATGEPVREYEFVLKFDDGEIRNLIGNASPLFDETGQPNGAVSAFIDITERKRVEQALRESESRFITIFQEAPFMMTLARQEDGAVVDVNRAFEKLFGYTRAEAIGRTSADLGIAPDPQARTRLFAQFKEQGYLHHLELTYITSAGKPVILSGNVDKITIGGQPFILSTYEDITDRKQSEQAAQQAQARLEAALNSMNDAIFISDTDGLFTHFNDAFATFHRFRSKDECAKTLAEYPGFLDVFFPDGTLTPLDMWAVPRALRGETGINVEYHLRRKDTGEGWVGSYNFAPIRNEAGAIVGSVVVGRDITEMKQAQEKLRFSEEKFAKAFATSPAAISITRLEDGQVLDVNQTSEAMFGFRREEVIGTQLNRQLWSDADERRRLTAILRDNGSFRNEEVSVLNFAGEPLRVLASAEILDLAGEKVAISTWLDISQRKKAEDALRESEEKFRTALTSIGDAVITTDPEGRVTFLNPVAERLTGWSGSEASGLPLERVFQIINEDTREPAENPVAKVLKSGKICSLANHTALIARDGGIIPIEDSAAPIQDANGQTHGVVMVFHDVTARRKAEKALRESERRFDTIARNIPGAVIQFRVLSDGPARIEYVSPSFEKRFGLPRNDYQQPGWELGALVHPEDRQAFLEALTKAFTAKTDILLECRMDLPIGIRWVQFRAYATPDEADIVYQGVITDITDRKEAEKRLAYLASFPEKNPNPVSEVDFSGKVRYMNPAIQKLFPDIQERGKDHPWLADWQNLTRPFLQDGKVISTRDVTISGRGYQQNLYFMANEGLIRIYGLDITKRMQAEQAMEAEKEWFRTTLASIGDAVITTDARGSVTFLNPVAEQLTGWTGDEASGRPLGDVFKIVNEQTHAPVEDPVMKVLASKLTSGLANHTALIHRNGGATPIEDSAAPIKDAAGEVLGVVMVFHDVTEKRKKEAELERLNRTLRALSNIDQALLRAKDENQYMDEVCQIVTQDCGHAMVWIGLAEQDEARTVRPVAYAGFEAGYLETLKITWADTERGRGPTGTAIRTGKISLCRNMLTDPNFKPWRQQALSRGYASSIVLPLLDDGKTFGAITIYSREPDPFSEGEIELLTELASDLAFGITVIRRRLEAEKAGQALRDSEARFRAIAESAPVGIGIVSVPDSRFLYVNGAYERGLGYAPGELAGMRAPDIYWDVEEREGIFAALKANGSITDCEVRLKKKNGAIFWGISSIRPINFDGKPALMGVFVDITERKDAEERAVQNTARLEVQRRLLEQREQERVKIARDLHDGPLQDLTAATLTLQGLIVDTEDPKKSEAYSILKSGLQSAISELRGYAQELRPPILSKFGLEKAIRSHAEIFQERYPKVKITFETAQEGGLLPEDLRLSLFRIYQEAMNNIAKHSPKATVKVVFQKRDREARLEIVDNGPGFEIPQDWVALARGGHLGLVGMRERAEAVGGRFEIHSRSGQGTRIRVVVPIQG